MPHVVIGQNVTLEDCFIGPFFGETLDGARKALAEAVEAFLKECDRMGTLDEVIIMTKPGVKRPVVIKTDPWLVPVTHIRTNMQTAAMTRERYFELLAMVK